MATTGPNLDLRRNEGRVLLPLNIDAIVAPGSPGAIRFDANGVQITGLESSSTVITTNTTLYVAMDGVDPVMGPPESTGFDVRPRPRTGTLEEPFATPHGALAYLSGFSLAPNVLVIIDVAAGDYVFHDKPLIFNHPQGGQIRIQGVAPVSAMVGPVLAKYHLDRTAPLVPARQAEQWFNACGTLSATATLVERAQKRDEDKVNNLNLINGTDRHWATTFSFTGNGYHPGIVILTALGLISNIAILGNQSYKPGIQLGSDPFSGESPAPPEDPFSTLFPSITGTSLQLGENVCIYDFAYGIAARNATVFQDQYVNVYGLSLINIDMVGLLFMNCSVTLFGVYVVGSAGGIKLTNSSGVFSRTHVTGCGSTFPPLMAVNSFLRLMEQTEISGNGPLDQVWLVGGVSHITKATISGGGNSGLRASSNAAVNIEIPTGYEYPMGFVGNGMGIFLETGATVSCQFLILVNNTNQIIASACANIHIYGSEMQTTGTITAIKGSKIFMADPTPVVTDPPWGTNTVDGAYCGPT